MAKISFETKKEGLRILKERYFLYSDVCEGEFADSLIEDFSESFDVDSMSTTLIMETIQDFRQWFHDRDDLESENYCEIEAAISIVKDESGVPYNEFQEYCYFDRTPVAEGTRVGVERINHETNEMFLDLDAGIYYA